MSWSKHSAYCCSPPPFWSFVVWNAETGALFISYPPSFFFFLAIIRNTICTFNPSHSNPPGGSVNLPGAFLPVHWPHSLPPSVDKLGVFMLLSFSIGNLCPRFFHVSFYLPKPFQALSQSFPPPFATAPFSLLNEFHIWHSPNSFLGALTVSSFCHC